MKLTTGVNFTNLCVPSKNLPAQSVWQIFCHSISPTNFKLNLYAEIRQMLFTVLPKKASHPAILFEKDSGDNMLVKLTPNGNF